MIKLFLQITGWTLAHTPEYLLKLLCTALGRTMLIVSPRRRRLVYSNLDHAFPDRPSAWRKKIAHASSERLFETALLSLAGPFMSERRLRSMIALGPDVDAWFGKHHDQPFPMVIGVPHLAYWEGLTWMGILLSKPMPEIGVIFRPLDNPAADAWVKRTRERFGMRLLSRRTGLQEAFKILKRNGAVGVLFDQNAGTQGALTTLLGRVCSTTELSGLLVEKSTARTIVYYPRRLGFWRMRFEVSQIQHDGSVVGTTLALNRWLETALTEDEDLCASWLWSHDRWRNQDVPERRFRLEAKRNLLPDDVGSRGASVLPRKTRIWIRMPNWLGDVVMALPLLRTLRTSRPDAEITVIAKPGLAPLLKACGVADHIETLPRRGRGYFWHFWRLRKRFPDVYVLFTHSQRGDIEAWLTRCRQRFGVNRVGKKRHLLTHAYAPASDFRESEHHQLKLWEAYFRHFGLLGDLDRSPLRIESSTTISTAKFPDPYPVIGFIAGSENSPEKRWPVEHWRTLTIALSAEFKEATFLLFGTPNDRQITTAIASGLGARVTDLAGKTDLPEYIARLQQCTVLVSNDTGGMHLANALGVPVIALFGPTNPVRTGPVFASPYKILQPPNCPPTGGGALDQLAPEAVAAAVREFCTTALARK